MNNKNKSKDYVQKLYKVIAALGDPIQHDGDGIQLEPSAKVPPQGVRGSCCHKTQQMTLVITDYKEDGSPNQWHVEPVTYKGRPHHPYVTCDDQSNFGNNITEDWCRDMFNNNQGPTHEQIVSGNVPDGYSWYQVHSVDWNAGKTCDEIDCDEILDETPPPTPNK